jgi:hypothetical protein
LLALEAAGKIESLETIESVRGKIIKPDMARHEIYARAIERQQKLYEKLISHRDTEKSKKELMVVIDTCILPVSFSLCLCDSVAKLKD